MKTETKATPKDQQHTAGEWEYTTNPLEIKNNDSAATIWRTRKFNNGEIGSTLIAEVSKSPGVYEAEANAKLIAAAPELLEALELVKICSSYKESKIYASDPAHWTNVIDRAIKKATK